MRPLIFVPVGNGKFDRLMIKIDELIEKKIIRDKVIAQIGTGKYVPKHFLYFTFKPSLEEYYQKADLVISHGGPGIVFEVLRRGKKLIAVPNRDRTDPRHQVEYLRAMAEETPALIYCDSVQELEKCLSASRAHRFRPYREPPCTMHRVIRHFLE